MIHRVVAGARALDRRIWILAAARTINTIGFSIVMPFLAMYLVEQRGASGTEYGSIYLVSGIIGALTQAAAGEASDRLGRRAVMISALILRGGNMMALGMAVIHEAPIWVLFGLIITNGMLRSVFEPAASAAVTDLATEKNRVAAFGLQRIGINLGWALGPALGGAFAVKSYGALFFFATPITLLAAVGAWRVKVEPRQHDDAGAAVKPPRASVLSSAATVFRENRAFASYLLLVLIGGAMTAQLFATFSVYARVVLGLGRDEIGLLYTVNGLLVVVLQGPAVAVINALGLRRALLLGPILYAAAYLSFGVSSSFATLSISIALLTAGEVLFAPALSDMAAVLGDPRRLGRAFGLFGLMHSFGISLGPIAGGAAFDHLRHEPVLMWAAISAGSLVVAAGYALFLRAHPNAAARA